VTPLVSALQPSSMLCPRGTSGYATRTVQTESISKYWATRRDLRVAGQTPAANGGGCLGLVIHRRERQARRKASSRYAASWAEGRCASAKLSISPEARSLVSLPQAAQCGRDGGSVLARPLRLRNF
jgi:hypothetical protein